MSNAHNKDGKYRGIIDEIREQQRKMKDMTWKERFAYTGNIIRYTPL